MNNDADIRIYSFCLEQTSIANAACDVMIYESNNATPVSVFEKNVNINRLNLNKYMVRN